MKIRILLSFIFVSLFATPAFAAKPTPTPTPPPVNSVCIDPGHGGSDPGAVNQDLRESDVNLQVAQLLKSKLEASGYTVYMTRTADVTLSNADRYNYCNSQNASVLISIHHNGSTDPNVDYSEALYMKRADVPLAQNVVGHVSSALGIANNGITRFASGVLIKANMPAIISEGLFLTNTNEYNLIKTSNRLDQETQALYSSVQAFFGN